MYVISQSDEPSTMRTRLRGLFDSNTVNIAVYILSAFALLPSVRNVTYLPSGFVQFSSVAGVSSCTYTAAFLTSSTLMRSLSQSLSVQTAPAGDAPKKEDNEAKANAQNDFLASPAFTNFSPLG